MSQIFVSLPNEEERNFQKKYLYIYIKLRDDFRPIRNRTLHL